MYTVFRRNDGFVGVINGGPITDHVDALGRHWTHTVLATVATDSEAQKIRRQAELTPRTATVDPFKLITKGRPAELVIPF